jgi:CheY-like chemotaxis protein
MNKLKYDIKCGADTYHAISGSRLQKWIFSGKITAGQVLCWRSGLSGWRKIEKIKELAPFFNEHAKRPKVAKNKQNKRCHTSEKWKIKNILLIDDEKDLGWILSEILTEKGYNVLTANTKQKALAILAEGVKAPDMVILDLNLPDGNGMNIIPKIKKISSKTIICIASAYGTAKKKEEAKRMGVSFFVDKPFDVETILKIIRRITQTEEDEQKE